MISGPSQAIDVLLARGAKTVICAEPSAGLDAWVRRAGAALSVAIVVSAGVSGAARPAQDVGVGVKQVVVASVHDLAGKRPPVLRVAPTTKNAKKAEAAPNAKSKSGQLLSRVADLSDVEIRIGGKTYAAMNPLERIRLCKEIASELKLNALGLDWRHLYATVHAETGWASRTGMGLNGKPSVGLAQMEHATAKSLGIDPTDAKQSLVGAAMLLKEAAAWAKVRRHGDKSAALSVYYNLSTKARNQWDGVSLDSLPQATQNHIRNAKDGLALAGRLGAKYEKLVLQAKAHEAEERRMLAQAGDIREGAIQLAAAPGGSDAVVAGVLPGSVVREGGGGETVAEAPLTLAGLVHGLQDLTRKMEDDLDQSRRRLAKAAVAIRESIPSLEAVVAHLEGDSAPAGQGSAFGFGIVQRNRNDQARVDSPVLAAEGGGAANAATALIRRQQMEMAGILEKLSGAAEHQYQQVALQSQAKMIRGARSSESMRAVAVVA